MSDRDPEALPIGADATDVDQAVTPIDTPVDERGDGETRPRPNDADACPVFHGAPGADRQNHGGQPHPTVGTANQVWWPNQLNLRILKKNPALMPNCESILLKVCRVNGVWVVWSPVPLSPTTRP